MVKSHADRCYRLFCYLFFDVYDDSGCTGNEKSGLIFG